MNFNSDHIDLINSDYIDFLSYNIYMPVNEISNLCKMHVYVHISRTSLLLVSQIHLGKNELLVLIISTVTWFSAGKKGNWSEHVQRTAYKEMDLQNSNSTTLFPSVKNYLVLSTPVRSSFSSSTLLLRTKRQALHE